MLFSTLAAPVCIPASTAQRFPFPHILAMLVICGLSEDSHPDRCEVVSHCGLDLHLPG